jgi:glycosyltransferase involved in cell wall biosynthesis
MASGRPIVATDLPTHTEVLDESSAVLVPATAEGLAHGILQALEDAVRAERLGEAARRRAERHHTSESLRRKLIEVYTFIERAPGRAPTAAAGGP